MQKDVYGASFSIMDKDRNYLENTHLQLNHIKEYIPLFNITLKNR